MGIKRKSEIVQWEYTEEFKGKDKEDDKRKKK